MKRAVLISIVISLATISVGAQSRFLPLGVNGSSVDVSTTVTGIIDLEPAIKNVVVTAGHSLGGKLDIQFTAGVRFADIDSSNEIVPGASINLNVLFFKQSPTIPFSMRGGMGLGFLTTLGGGTTSIVGSLTGFNVLLTRDFYINKLTLGFGLVFDYIHYSFDVTDTATSTTSTVNLDDIAFGGRIDLFFPYVKENLLTISIDLLTNTAYEFIMAFSLGFVFPTTY